MTPARRPLRRAQLVLAAVVAVAGVTVGVLTYAKLGTGLAAQPVSFPGAVTPAHTYPLNFGSEGTLAAVKVHPGQHVRSGQLLATESTVLAMAQLASARAQIQAARAQLAADHSLATSGVPAMQAQAQLQAAKAQLLTDRKAIAGASIVAPAAGTVAATAGTIGSAVGPAGLRGSGDAGTPVVTVDSGPLVVTASPPQADLAGLHRGQSVTLGIAGVPKPVHGSLAQIVAQAPGQGCPTGYHVVITIPGNVPHLSPGSTATITPN